MRGSCKYYATDIIQTYHAYVIPCRNDSVNYLGCSLGRTCIIRIDLLSMIAGAAASLNNMRLFWPHAMCPMQFNTQVSHAVLITQGTHAVGRGARGSHEL